MKKHLLLTLFAALVLSTTAASGKVKLPSVISDNMVLQQDTDVALWGWSEAGAKVTVKPSWSRSAVTVKAGPDGKWLVRVRTPKAGGPFDITFSDGQKTTVSNVLSGEVWLCSGQSNMEMSVKGYGSQPSRGGTDAILDAKPSRHLRICKIAKCSATAPQDTSKGSWQEHTPDAVAACSATAYYFADRLQRTLDAPVGIIVTSWGGSSIEAWMDEQAIRGGFAEELKLDHLRTGNVPEKQKHVLPCLLYNGQVNPLVPYTFKGIIWYQGETNRSRPEQYVRLQKAYVEMMRSKFDNPEAPFYFVQIAPYKYGNPDGFESGYFREAQQKSLEVIPNSGMATTTDIGEYGTIHPCRKREVGDRLAYLALGKTYGYKVIDCVAPTYKSISVKGSKVTVSFNDVTNGLVPMGAPLPGFEVAGADSVFHKADAMLAGDRKSVTVSCPEVKAPVAVRYCFRNWQEGILTNIAGVAVGPFRTDDWQL